jgi:hypothetical protein
LCGALDANGFSGEKKAARTRKSNLCVTLLDVIYCSRSWDRKIDAIATK